jgi:hypothetical protein
VVIKNRPGDNSLASAGFPTRGNPFNRIYVNVNVIGRDVTPLYATTFMATLLAHELGHCIGFRHTDYFNRPNSCGFNPNENPNEGPGLEGVVHIPGTPVEADPNSWMLACLKQGDNRPFTANDRIALNFVY